MASCHLELFHLFNAQCQRRFYQVFIKRFYLSSECEREETHPMHDVVLMQESHTFQ